MAPMRAVCVTLLVALFCLHHVSADQEGDDLKTTLGDTVWHFPNFREQFKSTLGQKSKAPDGAGVELKDPVVLGPATASIGTAESFPAVDLGASAATSEAAASSGASASAAAGGMDLTSGSTDASPAAASASASGSGAEENTLGAGSSFDESSDTAAASGTGDAPSVMEAAPLGLQDESAPAKCETENACDTRIVKSLTPGGKPFTTLQTIVHKDGTASEESVSQEEKSPLDDALEKKDAVDPEIKKLRDELQSTVDRMKADKTWINNITNVIHQYRTSINQRKAGIRQSGKKYFDLKRKIKERTDHNFRELMRERLASVHKALNSVREESDKIKGTHRDLQSVRAHLSAQIANFQKQIMALRASEYFDQ